MSARTSPFRPLRQPLAIAVALAIAPLAGIPTAHAQMGLPTNGTVAAGVASISSDASTMTINQTSKGAVINWTSFDVGVGNTVNFVQPGIDSVTLNRVTGSDSSTTIYGTINGNGRVFIINPNGVMFGESSKISVGGLVASTLSISDSDFMSAANSGQPFVFGDVDDSPSGVIVNEGIITTPFGGTVALLSTEGVDNIGTITADGGTIALGWGGGLELDIGGDGLTKLVIRPGFGGYSRANVSNRGTLRADGGNIVIRTDFGDGGGVVNLSGTTRARSLESRNGVIVLDGNLNEVEISGTVDVSTVTHASTKGSMDVNGGNVLLDDGSALLADGGGTINVSSTGVIAMSDAARISADGTANGDGGSVRLFGNQGLRAYGSISAKGGSGSGNGGLVETSSDTGLDLTGLRVNASAPNGTAGTWLTDPYDVTIVNGAATGSLGGTGGDFDPVTATTLQDGDINAALDSGTSVTISTGTGGGGAGTGNITLSTGVLIERTVGTDPLNFRLDAHNGISGTGFTIRSSAGPLNILFNSDANGLIGPFGNGIQLGNSSLLSNGGDIRMFGESDPLNGYAGGIDLFSSAALDTRINGSDSAPAGDVVLRAWGDGDSSLYGTGVQLSSSAFSGGPITIRAGTGDIDILGRGGNGGDGISMDASSNGSIELSTSTGGIRLRGFGSEAGTSAFATSSAGIRSTGSTDGNVTLRSNSGLIDLRGYGIANTDDGSLSFNVAHHGIQLGQGTRLLNLSGDLLLTGSSLGDGTGILLSQGALADAGNGNIVLRAHNLGTGVARVNPLQMEGVLRSSRIVTIRGGSVVGSGDVVENPDQDIFLAATECCLAGIHLSADDLSRIQADTLVLGSAQQTGDIVIPPDSDDIIYGGNLTLHAGGGGNISMQSTNPDSLLDVGPHTLALIGGAIDQGALSNAIVAGSLLAIANNGDVSLINANNDVAAQTVAGRASGAFSFINTGDLGIGTVNATGFDSTTNAAVGLTASGIDANADVFAQSMSGNLLLNGDVAGNIVQLVAGPSGIFLNPSASGINANSYWRVWASTWVSETRNGVTGGGILPNLYGCAYSGSCGVTPTATNQFIYADRPTLAVTVADATRTYGGPDAPLTYNVTGMVLGDIASNVLTGNLETPAVASSGVGSYAITGNFTSPAGYLFNVSPATLAITPATLTYIADPYSRPYGSNNALLGGSLVGFVLGDTQASATTGGLNFTTSATQTSGVGNYAIIGSGLSANNYVFTQAAGNATAFAITPVTLTYTADPYSRTYGDSNGSLTGTVSGFVLNDTLASATTGNLSFTSNATEATHVGSHAIHGGGLSATNYVFAQAAGNATALNITPATLVYTANPFSRTYGDSNGVLTGTVTGFLLNDTLANATTGTLDFTSTATASSDVGTYAITGSGLSAGNYVFTQANSNADALSVTPATLTYVANPSQRLVGTPNEPFTGYVTGLRNGDTLNDVASGTLRFDSNADIHSPVGAYGIFGSGLSASNYTFVQADGNAHALVIVPQRVPYVPELLRNTPQTYVYDRNFGIVGMCPATDLAAGSRDQDGDMLAREWSRVRSRPNLANCVSTRQKNSCGDF